MPMCCLKLVTACKIVMCKTDSTCLVLDAITCLVIRDTNDDMSALHGKVAESVLPCKKPIVHSTPCTCTEHV